MELSGGTVLFILFCAAVVGVLIVINCWRELRSWRVRCGALKIWCSKEILVVKPMNNYWSGLKRLR